MKKIYVLLFILSAIALQFCTSSKKMVTKTKTKTQALTYTGNVKPLIQASCSPCHIAGQGNKKDYSSYANAKGDIDDILRRIQLNPTDRGFMPFKHPKLSDADIHVFQQWKADGLAE